MNNTYIFLILFLAILVPAHLIVFRLIFKKTINYTIGMVMSVPIITSITIAYFVDAEQRLNGLILKNSIRGNNRT